MNYDCLKITFDEYTSKIKSLPITKANEFDGILIDLSNHVYDTYEFICEPPKIKDKKEVIELLNSLLERITAMLDFISDIDYDSKYMSRSVFLLSEIEDAIPELIEKLEGQA